MKIEITEQQLGRINDSLLNEGGIRDINKLAERYPKAEIYFHQDLDGVVSALGMKNYLENYGIEVIGSHVIQYGDNRYSKSIRTTMIHKQVWRMTPQPNLKGLVLMLKLFHKL